ncbi:Aldo/keto reductase [Aspergillus affinis]|uniref:Aldo/keto reductase n=1 Tax=Aspergillus affinis TaxID=1070780 RepID=UPI0022FE73A5|nr:Aldo/keto reductase [Aspergillus affinis]KAI9044991.1 Aldo/keto reductase [Aspergillus affinis]
MDAPDHSRLLKLPPIILGGAGFSYQIHPDPKSIPIPQIIRRAFDVGMKAIDTSPYYEPSEQLLGEALASPEVTGKYSRSDYILMTKAGRISADQFDYSAECIQKSVQRSLDRLGTSYLDVVFCHDVEFVSMEEAIQAVGALFELSEKGQVRCVGISGYSIDRLVRIAHTVQKQYNRPLDIVQNWAQMTLQNTRLERYGIPALRGAGVSTICSSSPLASGLLRAGDVPSGKLGDWHPAPDGLRSVVKQSSNWVEKQGSTLAGLALRFSLARANRASNNGVSVHTILGICSLSDIESNVHAAQTIFQSKHESDEPDISVLQDINEEIERVDHGLCHKVREILGEWVEYDFETGKKESKVSLWRRREFFAVLILSLPMLVWSIGFNPVAWWNK